MLAEPVGGSPLAGRSGADSGNTVNAMRALLAIVVVLLQAGTHARMATPCRAGTDHCRLVNTQKSIRAAADRARKSAAEAKDAVRMSRATSVARKPPSAP